MHPAVIEAQRRWMERSLRAIPAAVAVLESALIFEVERDALARGEKDSVLADWRRRMDRVVVVTVPDEVKIQRYASTPRPFGAVSELAARSRCAQSAGAPDP